MREGDVIRQELDELERATWTVMEDVDFTLEAIEAKISELAARMGRVERLLADAAE